MPRTSRTAWTAFGDVAAYHLRFKTPTELRGYLHTEDGTSFLDEGLSCIPVWQSVVAVGPQYAAYRKREGAESTTDVDARADERRTVLSLWFMLAARAVLDESRKPMGPLTFSLWVHAKAVSQSTVGLAVYLAPAYWSEVGARVGFTNALGDRPGSADQLAIWSTADALSQVSVLTPDYALREADVASRLLGALQWWKLDADLHTGDARLERVGNLLLTATLGVRRLNDGFVRSGAMNTTTAVDIEQAHESAVSTVLDQGLAEYETVLSNTRSELGTARTLMAGDYLVNEMLSAKLTAGRQLQSVQNGAGCSLSLPEGAALTAIASGARVSRGYLEDRDLVWANQVLSYELSQVCSDIPSDGQPGLADRFTTAQAIIWQGAESASCGLAERTAVCGLIGQDPAIASGLLAAAWRSEWLDRCGCARYPRTGIAMTK